MNDCPCQSGTAYDGCCEPVIRGTVAAASPEQLMRARYTAHAKQEIDFILRSVEPSQQKKTDRASVEAWSKNAVWQGIDIIATQGGGEGQDTGTVEFVARYAEDGVDRQHHEIAAFRRLQGRWYFDVKGTRVPGVEPLRAAVTVGRNDPCSCGSGKKYKKCCGA